MTRLTAGLGLALLVATGCAPPPRHRAQVQLEVDGTPFEYVTHRAQYDQQVAGGPLSVYLVPDVPEAGTPYACLRYYSGNPVGHLWVRYRKPDAPKTEGELPRWECFAPGRLSDGTETLGWKTSDGKERHKTETGEKDCLATATWKEDGLHMLFEGVLRPAKGKKRKGQSAEAAAAEAGTVRVSGRALLQATR